MSGVSRLGDEGIAVTVCQDVQRWMEQQSWGQLRDGAAGRSRGALRPPNTISHDVAWHKEKVYTPISVHIPRTFWSARASDGQAISEDDGIGDRSPLQCFMSVFQYSDLFLI